jgi:hypothetical protein
MAPPARMRMVVLVCMLTGCTTANVDLDFDRTVDFASYHTFTWDAALPGAEDDLVRTDTAWPLTFQNTIREVLTQRGLVELPGDAAKAPAQMRVRYFGTADQSVAIRQMHTRDERLGAAGSRNWRSRSGVYNYIGKPDYETQVRETGFLMIEMIDTQTGRMIWRATGTVDLHGIPDTASRIRRGVQQMLKSFPPYTSA